MPPHPHYNMPQHPYSIILSRPILSCLYFTYTPMYAPHIVPRHSHIPSLSYPYIPPGILPSSMLINLLTPEAHTRSSRMIS